MAGDKPSRSSKKNIEASSLHLSPLSDTWLEKVEKQLPPAQSSRKSLTKSLVYGLQHLGDAWGLRIFQKSVSSESSTTSFKEMARAVPTLLTESRALLQDQDIGLLEDLTSLEPITYVKGLGYALSGRVGYRVLQAAIATGRCYISTPTVGGSPLRESAVRTGSWVWSAEENEQDRWSLHCLLEPPAEVLALHPLMYFDAANGCVGQIVLETSPSLSATLLKAPSLSGAETALVAKRLRAMTASSGVALPIPEQVPSVEWHRVDPIPCLHLTSAPQEAYYYYESHPRLSKACVRLSFLYHDWEIHQPHDEAVMYRHIETKLHGLERDLAAEEKALQALVALGLRAYPSYYQRGAAHAWCLHHENQDFWGKFVTKHLPSLEQQGWKISTEPDFPVQIHEARWFDVELNESSQPGWFDVALDVEIDGRRVALAGLLAEAIYRYGKGIFESIEADDGEEVVLIPWQPANSEKATGAKGKNQNKEKAHLWPFPKKRLAPLLQVLRDWLDTFTLGKPKTAPRIFRFDLRQIYALDQAGILGRSVPQIRKAAQGLSRSTGVPMVAVPVGLKAKMRPYQVEGLSWLSFLAEHELNGLLADDMGLGKTLQTIAFICREYEAGRLTRPALVVAPTSLMRNWKDEIQRYAPSLSVLALHGSQRQRQFGSISQYAVVLTSYALVHRDIQTLSEQPWHLIVLDESQRIKNARSLATQGLKTLNARHRFCLSGTPVENHLGELWTQFDFLLPDLLGTSDEFRDKFRTPVEKHGDARRAQQLAERIRPFMLRRTKEQVAKELPSKTETIVKIELEGKQRDLYETVRSTMDGKLRHIIREQGFARSQIMVLEALLKLRQVCSDPRLLKGTTSTSMATLGSAKGSMLVDMLQQLIEEGRRILVFSSFAEMLKLIDVELTRQKISHHLLIGESTDRAEQVQAFQTGTADVFLISLKAGGVGLNLTAADTVILYDPWWNPAAEQQAIDRVHRIGQDKPVFIYKLIAAGTIEERILTMQAKKLHLADQILAGAVADLGLTEEDFEELLKPLA